MIREKSAFRPPSGEVLINVPVVVLVFLMFLSGQTLMLYNLMDPPVVASMRDLVIVWIGVALHSFLVVLLVMWVAGWMATALPRPGRAILWTLLLMVSTLLIWDFITYTLIRQHFFNGARLFWENIFLDREIMHARKKPLVLTLAAYGAGLVGFITLFSMREQQWRLLAWRTSLRTLAIASLVALAIAIAGQLVGRHFLPPAVYRGSLESQLSILRFIERHAPMEDALFHVQAPHFRPPPRIDDTNLLASLKLSTNSPHLRRPNIYFFVIESWRRDCATPEVTPNLAAFSTRCLRIDKTVANANQTHFSLTAIVHGLSPFYFGTFFNRDGYPGAVPIRVLKELGYKVKVLASPDLYYFKFAKATFGPNHQLADSYLDQKELLKRGFKDPSMVDEFVVQRFTEEVLRQPQDSPCFYLVMLDSSHIDYYWGESFAPPFRPFSERVKVVPIGFDPAQIEPLRNRYKNALAYVDMLMGRALHALEQRGDLERAIIVVTGDHGEEFLERGHMVHGSELNHFQLDVPLWIHLPGVTNSARIPIASHVDIFPTVFDYMNVRGEFQKCLSGSSLIGTTPPSAAICVQHLGPLPTSVVLDCGARKLWLDIAGGERVGRSLAADYLIGTRLLDSLDQAVKIPAGRRGGGKVPEEFIPSLKQLITYP